MATKKEQAPADGLVCIKGFDSSLKCRGMQYAVGETVEHDGPVKICESGLHAVEYPLDVFSYYPPAGSRFAVVRAHGEIDRKSDGEDTKIAAARLTIEAEIGVPELVSRAIEWITSRCEIEEGGHATGCQGAASATGMLGAASATGDHGAASATGMRGAASATGTRGAASATGKHSVAVSVGFAGQAKAREGAAIVLCHRTDDGSIVHIRAAVAGRDGVKVDTWYTLGADGEFVEVQS